MNINKIKKISIILIIICMFSAVIGCSNDQGSSVSKDSMEDDKQDGIEITDMTGEKVVLEKIPDKIVSLTPANTEILFDLGLEDKIVGVTEYCDYPEQAKSKPKVGDFEGPNIEAIAEIMPDLVVAGGYMHEDAIKQLKDLGITIISSEASTFEDIYNSIQMIGKATGTDDKADEIIKNMKNKVDQIKENVKDKQSPKVFFIVGYGNDLWTVSQGSFIHDVLEICGAINIAKDGETPWSKYSMEKVVEQNPDVIFTTEHAGDIEQIKKDDALKNTNAMKNGKFFVIEDNIIVRGTPRILEGMELIYKYLYEQE